MSDEERRRLENEGAAYRRFGPYLSERQWGTVREDYSENGQGNHGEDVKELRRHRAATTPSRTPESP